MSKKSFHPLTSPQLSIWYTEQMYSGTSISNVAGTLRIQEKVDFSLLEKAIQLFIRNNDGMRLRVCLDENGNPQQYVSEYAERKIPYIDFSTHEDSEKAFYDWNNEMTLKPFELLDNDLYSFTMVKISDSDGGFYVITHHLISDAWNMSLIGSFIVDYYCKLKNEITDENAFLPKPSYLSFIENDIAYKSSNRYEKDKLFWEETFHEMPELTVLKTRTTNRISAKAKRKTFVAPARFIDQLKGYCTEHKVSPYPLFLSALTMYFNRISGKEDIILGTPILNRLNHSDKNTSGMFISTIPLRLEVHADETFQALSERVMEVCSSAFRHQRYPFNQILRFVRDRHNIKENLYDIVLSYQNSKFDKSHEVDYFTRWHFNGYQPNSLTIHINDRDDEGTVILDYDYHEDLYDDREIEFLHQHILGLLWHALDNPGMSICKLEMLPESEKRKVLYEFNDTAMDYPREKLIHQLFEEQVERTPDNVAIVFEEKTMTYRELNERANQLAHVLRRKGVKRDDIVGILVPRSFELIIGIMAILKAGGAFMTIEPDFPSDRIRYMMENSKAAILLTSGSTQVDIPAERINVFDETVYSGESKENPVHINNARDLVYVIYTSGTTGSPKGVMIEHRSLHNFVCSIKKIFTYDSKSAVLCMASICFDVFALEVFPTVLNGSKLVLCSKNQQMIPHELATLIQRNQVTTILSTPAVLKLLVDDEKSRNSLSGIQFIMSGGEKFDSKLLARLRELTGAKIINAYGPTEATIAVTFSDITHTDKITIGKPIGNTKIYILDRHKNIVPIGVKGSLYVSGDCLSRGYLHNPELTGKSFIQGFVEGERLYATGDLARWYPEGDIDFIGREDKQVKLRGYRIELEEIENTLLRYDSIKDVVILNRKDDIHGEFLCAYYVSYSPLDSKQIRSFLEKNLPQYMVPKFIIQVESIPVTSNGKIDTEALMRYDCSSYNDTEIIEPSNEIEVKISGIVSQLLNVKKLSTEADIFELGADSLTVIQMVSLLNQEGYIVKSEDIYRCPTVKKLSQHVKLYGEKQTKCNRYHSKQTEQYREIEKQIERGELEPIDSAAISYVPDDIDSIKYLSQPTLIQYIKTSLGNIGFYIIPIKGVELYRNRRELLSLCLDTVQQAEAIGARVISLTGLIPSATSYGVDLISKIQSGISITTGHATTAASVVLTIDKMLNLNERNIDEENIVVIGMGSVGKTVTELLLRLYPSIKRISLCELYKNKDHMREYKEKLEALFNTKVHILFAQDTMPEEVYQASLIIGATNVPEIIDVNRLQPGTLIVDDSGPHCFNTKDAIRRLERCGDILFTEGGVLKFPSIMEKITYIPENIQLQNRYKKQLSSKYELTGCVLSSLLTDKYKILSPTIGRISYNESIKHYNVLRDLKFEAADLHCENYTIPLNKIQSFVCNSKIY